MRAILLFSLLLNLGLPHVSAQGLIASFASMERARMNRTNSTVDEEAVIHVEDANETEEGLDTPRTHDAFARHLSDGATIGGFLHRRALHFTFDDGPRLDTTPRLLEHLDAAGVRATFFVVTRGFDGDRNVQRRKAELVRAIVARGHTIGSHTHRHPNLTDLGIDGLRAELDACEHTFDTLFGARPALLRAPYGARNARVSRELRRRGYTQVLWNITFDESQRSPAIVEDFAAMLRQREHHPRGPGGIVLLHDTRRRVVDAIPGMVAAIRARNCELYAEGEELWDVLDTPDAFAPEHRRDDAWFDARERVLQRGAEARCNGL